MRRWLKRMFRRDGALADLRRGVDGITEKEKR